MATVLQADEKPIDVEQDETLTGGNTIIDIDHEAEKKLLRKLDLRIMPLIMGLYLFVRHPFIVLTTWICRWKS